MPNSVFLNMGAGGEQFTGQMIGPPADNTSAPPYTFSGDLDSGLASSVAGTVNIVADGTAALAATATALTLASGVIETVQNNGLATTSTDGLVVSNTTAATGGATVQISPRLRFRGTAWDTAASETLDWIIENLPATAATPTSTLKVGFSLNGAAYSYPFVFSNAGGFTIKRSIAFTDTDSEVKVGATGFFYWNGRGVLTSPADSKVAISNNAANAGFTLDASTSGTCRFQNFAASALAPVIASSFSNTNATNGQSIGILQELTELTTIAAAASTDTTIQMPANSVVLAVTVRTTVVIPTATSYSVGDSGSATRFSTANVGVAANSTDPGTKAGAYYNASALSVRLTMNGGTPAANTGRVRVSIFYYSVTPPTS